MTGKQRWRVSLPDNDKVSLDGMVVSTIRLEISESVFSPFVYGEWGFSASETSLEDQYFSVGTKLIFTMVGDAGDEIEIPLCILSLLSGPGMNAETMPGTFFMTLVSPWYFEQYPYSKAYKGSASTVVKTIMDSGLKDSFKGVDISDTYDNAGIIKYQTFQSPVSFIEKKILPYAIGKEFTSVYCFTNNLNEFSFIDIDKIRSYPKYSAVDISNKNISKYQPDLSDTAKAPYVIYPNSIILNINGSEKHMLWGLSNAGMIYNERTSPAFKGADDYPVLPYMGLDYTENKFVPVTEKKDKSKVSYNYIDDSLDILEKIQAKTLFNLNRGLMNEFSIDMVIHSSVSVHVGRLCFLDIHYPYNLNKPSIFSQDYLISHVSHVFQTDSITTTVSLTTPCLHQDNTDKIVGFFKT